MPRVLEHACWVHQHDGEFNYSNGLHSQWISVLLGMCVGKQEICSISSILVKQCIKYMQLQCLQRIMDGSFNEDYLGIKDVQSQWGPTAAELISIKKKQLQVKSQRKNTFLTLLITTVVLFLTFALKYWLTKIWFFIWQTSIRCSLKIFNTIINAS